MKARSVTSMPLVKTIIFDLGRTLIHFSHAPLEPALHACGERGREEAKRLMIAAECGAVGAAELQAGLSRLCGLNPAEFPAWWNAIFDSGWLVPPEWIRGLKPLYRLGILSNTNAEHYEFLLRQRPLLREFDFAVLSHVVGAAKPDPRIYATAEQAANCAPDSIFYTDDIADFVEVARRRAWQAHQFSSFPALKTALRKAVHQSIEAEGGILRQPRT